MVFHPRSFFTRPGRLAMFLLMGVLALSAQAASPGFFVTVNTLSAPVTSELWLAELDPLSNSVVTVSNSQSEAITNSPGDDALDFSPNGTLYGMANGVLSIINPATAVASNFVALANEVTRAPVAGTALAFGADGTLYISDGYQLYVADPTTGASTEVNPFHTNGATSKLTTPIFGLATAPNGTLFGGDLNLYTIDPATAEATAIGLLCNYPDFVRASDMAFGSDGNLYMIGLDFFGDSALYAVDTNNAAVTLVEFLPGAAVGLASSLNPAAPFITAQPASQTVAPGGAAHFSVAATGTPAPKAVWFFDNAPYPSGTNLSLAITNLNATNAGEYFVVLTNTFGAITSSVATLTVSSILPPATNFTFLASSVASEQLVSLSTNPVSETVLASDYAQPACLAFDTNNILYGGGSYLTQINTNNWGVVTVGRIQIPGVGTNPPTPLTLTGMAFSSGNVLYGIASNTLYTIVNTNGDALYLADFPPNFFISAIAFGPKGVLYGGQSDLYTINSTNGAVTGEIGNLFGPTLTIGSDMKVGADGYIYFGNGEDVNLYRLDPQTAGVTKVASFGSVISGLAFYPAPFDSSLPVITSPEVNEVAALGGTVTISATVAGGGPKLFQWSHGPTIVQDGSRIHGSATSSITISNLMAADAGTYALVVSNAFGSTTRAVAVLALGAGPAITVQPSATTRIQRGEAVTLSVTATGGTAASPLLYQWLAGGEIVPGESNRTLSLAAEPANGFTNLIYTVLVRDSFGVALSAPAQVTVLPSAIKSTVAITTPARAGARSASANIAGTASAGVASVWLWLTNFNDGVITKSGPWAATITGNSSWSATPALLPGTNFLTVQSSNLNGNVSPLLSRQFFYEVKSPLTVASLGGNGTFTGKAAVAGDTVPANNALLNMGEGYSITARPEPGWLFTNWTSGLGTVAQPTLNFVMESNLSLTANFTTNQFFGLSGIYNGLFPNNGPVTVASAGMIRSLTIRTNGAFSGTLVLQGTSHTLAGSFNSFFTSASSITTSAGALVVQMNLLTNNYPNQIVGSVTGPNWSSDLHLIANATGALPSFSATMALPPATNRPGGYGSAVITDRAGSVAFSGSVADGASFTPTAPISQAGNVPVYASLYGNTGVLTGWLSFDTGEYGDHVPDGQLTWIREPAAGASIYSSGSNLMTVLGAIWVTPTAGQAVLPFTTIDPGYLQIAGGNLAEPLSFTIAVSAKGALSKLPASEPTNSLTGSVNPKSGLLTLSFGNGKGKATTAGTGVVLQSSSNAFGSFLGTTNTGSISLQ